MKQALSRLFRIRRIANQYGLVEFFPRADLSLIARIALNMAFSAKSHEESRAQRLRLALESLGPVFIKFGQTLSTRRDLLPPDIADELAKLQDQVPPFDTKIARQTIEDSLGQSIEDVFDQFEDQPLASASVAQVHRARLKSGEAVVIKVIRPDIRPQIEQDTAWMALIARWLVRFHPQGHRLKAEEIVSDYRQTILDELDLAREAANASQLRRNFEDSEQLYVPKVYWEFTRSQVYTMEEVSGTPVNDRAKLESQGVNFQCLAERGVEIFFTQVLRDSFFHADMHPGNIFVDASNPEKPGYIALDCAIIGSLSDDDLYYLARNLLSIFQRDYRRVAQLHLECGWVPRTTNPIEFESAIRTVCEPVFDKPIAELSFGQLLLNLFQTASRFDMPIQPSFVLLQKTLLNIEGLGRELYPQLNLWDTAQPFLERWMRERYSLPNTLKRMQAEAPTLLENLPRISANLADQARARSSEPNPPKQKPATNSQSRTTLLPAFGIGAAAMYIGLTYDPMAGASVAALFLLITVSKRV